MPKFKVTATMDVAYELVVEAPNRATAWQIAEENDTDWVKADARPDFTLEHISEVKDD